MTPLPRQNTRVLRLAALGLSFAFIFTFTFTVAGCARDAGGVTDAGMKKLGVKPPRPMRDAGTHANQDAEATTAFDASVSTSRADAASPDAMTDTMDASREPNDAHEPVMIDASSTPPQPMEGGPGALLDATMLTDAALPPGPPPDILPHLPFRDAGPDDDDDGGARVPPPPCSGKHGSPGTSMRMYNNRAYLVHIPTIVDPNQPVPVVFLVHGANGTGEQMQQGTQFDLIADVEGFVTVYPNGGDPNSPWNVGRGACLPGGAITNNNDDFTYFERMLDDVEQDQCVDRDAVFVTGFSMGGYFSHHIGCQRGNSFTRAVAPHSGGTYAGDCPGAPLPVLILHGDADPLINLSCAKTARDRWVERNGCAADFDTFDIQGGHCEWNRACPDRGQVALCVFNNLQHSWAYPPDYEHSSLLIWSFFKHYLR